MKKREEKEMQRIDEILSKLPQIEKELDSDPSTLGEGWVYMTTLFTNGMRVSKFRHELCKMRETGDFSAEYMGATISKTDSLLELIIQEISAAHTAIKEKEKEAQC